MTALLALLLQAPPDRSLPAHPRRCERVQVGADGKLAFTLGDPDRVVKVWRLDAGRVLHSLGERANAFALHPDGGLVAVGGDDGVRVFNVVSGEATRALDVPRCLALGWSGAEPTTVAIGPGGLTATSGARSITIPLPRKATWAVVDGLRVAVPHNDAVRVWDVAEDKVLFERPGRTIAFGPGGRTATAGGGVVRVWEGAQERTLEAAYDSTPSLAFSGETLLVGTDAGIEVWSGGRRTIYKGPGTGLFYPDSMGISGSTLYAGGTLILKDAPASGRAGGPVLFWKLR